jgi:hypothetical protein
VHFIVYLYSDSCSFLYSISYFVQQSSVQQQLSNYCSINIDYCSIIALFSDPGNVFQVYWSHYHHPSIESIIIVQIQDLPTFILVLGIERPIATIDVKWDLRNHPTGVKEGKTIKILYSTLGRSRWSGQARPLHHRGGATGTHLHFHWNRGGSWYSLVAVLSEDNTLLPASKKSTLFWRLRKLCYAEPTVSPEKLQPLTLVTRVLSKRVEEVTGDVTCYLEQLINPKPH